MRRRVRGGRRGRRAQQLAAGSLNVAQAATDQSLRAILRGAAIRIVAGAASNPPFRVVAAKTVTRWSELKGKAISVGGLTDVTLYFLRVMARRNGLADHDYDLLFGGGTPNRFAQLASGAVAAAILTNPGAGLRRSRQRAAISARLGAEQYPHRYPLGAAKPRRVGGIPARSQVNIPRQSRGLYFMSRSKRLVGSLTRPLFGWAT